jgi:hypothetical protein
MVRALKLSKEENPALQRIADMLTKAFDEIGDRIRRELVDAYRDYAKQRFEHFIETAKTRSGEICPRDVQRRGPAEFDDLHRYAAFDRKGAGDPYGNLDTWEKIRPLLKFYSLTYKYADEEANTAYESARDSFVYKNLGKMRTVLGKRTDLKNAVIKFAYTRGVFEGNLQVYLEGVYIRAEISLKYVIRRIPNVTPYFQYPLVFTEAEVDGKRYARPSEEELRVLLSGISTAKAKELEAAELASEGWCPTSGTMVPEPLMRGQWNRMSPWVKCPTCGSGVSAQHGKFRKHKTPEAEKAERGKKLVAEGYCPMSKEKIDPKILAPFTAPDGYISYDVKVACEGCGQTVKIDSTARRYQKHKLK